MYANDSGKTNLFHYIFFVAEMPKRLGKANGHLQQQLRKLTTWMFKPPTDKPWSPMTTFRDNSKHNLLRTVTKKEIG
jgi:hypothetical protein